MQTSAYQEHPTRRAVLQMLWQSNLTITVLPPSKSFRCLQLPTFLPFFFYGTDEPHLSGHNPCCGGFVNFYAVSTRKPNKKNWHGYSLKTMRLFSNPRGKILCCQDWPAKFPWNLISGWKQPLSMSNWTRNGPGILSKRCCVHRVWMSNCWLIFSTLCEVQLSQHTVFVIYFICQ